MGQTKQCLRPGCLREPKVRGVCPQHYYACRRRVRAGLAAWKQLEQEGKTAPLLKHKKGKHSEWLD